MRRDLRWNLIKETYAEWSRHNAAQLGASLDDMQGRWDCGLERVGRDC